MRFLIADVMIGSPTDVAVGGLLLFPGLVTLWTTGHSLFCLRTDILFIVAQSVHQSSRLTVQQKLSSITKISGPPSIVWERTPSRPPPNPQAGSTGRPSSPYLRSLEPQPSLVEAMFVIPSTRLCPETKLWYSTSTSGAFGPANVTTAALCQLRPIVLPWFPAQTQTQTAAAAETASITRAKNRGPLASRS